MLTTIFLVIAALVAVFLIAVTLRPPTFHIERSIAIGAAPADLFPRLNDLQQCAVWQPWLKKDPTAKVAYEGPAAGTGAASTWSGNKQVGEGRQTIVESRTNELVRLKLEFKKPFAAICIAEFALKPAAAQTVVTWSMSGEANFMVKAMNLLGVHDKIVGGQFAAGLAALKVMSERAAKN